MWLMLETCSAFDTVDQEMGSFPVLEEKRYGNPLSYTYVSYRDVCMFDVNKDYYIALITIRYYVYYIGVLRYV